MNGISESWSLPWHTLQRSVAAQCNVAPASSWLARVRSANESDLLERRWFAAARARCSHLEALRDALGGELADIDHSALKRSSPPAQRPAD